MTLYYPISDQFKMKGKFGAGLLFSPFSRNQKVMAEADRVKRSLNGNEGNVVMRPMISLLWS